MPEETLSAKLLFDESEAVRSMAGASAAFTRLGKSAKRTRQGVANLRKGFQGFNIAVAGLAGTGALAVKKFADFDGQMGAVKAVLGKEAQPAFEDLEEQALKLGATTSFTATQAAEAMENLARAGLDTDQIMSSLGPTLAAAAADGLDLGTAADIVASNMKAFGLEAKDATRIADALAFVSSKTNTNMIGLQEGLKFVAPVARSMGIQLEDTAAALGVLADVGLKGTLAGTGLKNALLKIAKTAKGGKVAIGKYKAEVAFANDGTVNLSGTMLNITQTLQKIKNPLKRSQAAMKLLGLRGMGAAAAFDALGKDQEKVNTLFEGMQKRAKGTAAEMQRMRLDTLKGDFTLLTSAIDGMATSIGKALRNFIQPFIKGGEGITKMIGESAQLITRFWGANGEMGRAILEMDLLVEGFGRTAVSFAKGFVAGVKGAAEVFSFFGGVLRGVGRFVTTLFNPGAILGESGAGVSGLTTMAFKLGAIAISVKFVTTLFGRMGRIAVGSIQVITGALGTAKTGLGGLITLISKRLPTLARILPRGLSKLFGAAKLAEQVTAQPVRVVNFNEMGVPGIGAPGAPGAAGPRAAGRAAKKSFKELGKLGKVARVAGASFGILGAAIAGLQLGRAIDEATGLSTSLAGMGETLAKTITGVDLRAIEAKRVRAGLAAGTFGIEAGKKGTAAQTARQFAEFHKQGVKVEKSPGGKRVAVSRELAAEAVRRKFKGGRFTEEQKLAILAAVKPILDRIPTTEQIKAIAEKPTVIKIDGREIGRTSERTKTEKASRGIRRGPTPRTAAAR